MLLLEEINVQNEIKPKFQILNVSNSNNAPTPILFSWQGEDDGRGPTP